MAADAEKNFWDDERLCFRDVKKVFFAFFSILISWNIDDEDAVKVLPLALHQREIVEAPQWPLSLRAPAS